MTLRAPGPSVVKCPIEHQPEMRKALTQRLSFLVHECGEVMSSADELGDVELANELASIIERIRRQRMRMLEGA